MKNKIVNVTLTGGILGLLVSSPQDRLNEIINEENTKGWRVIQIIPAASGNFFLWLYRALILLITLFIYQPLNGYYVIMEKKQENNEENIKINSNINKAKEPLSKSNMEIEGIGLKTNDGTDNKMNNKPKLSDISPDILNSLNEEKKSKIEVFLNLMGKTDIIILHDNKIKLIDEERWRKINEQGIWEGSKVIYKWNI